MKKMIQDGQKTFFPVWFPRFLFSQPAPEGETSISPPSHIFMISQRRLEGEGAVKKEDGFTLVELMIALAITLIIMASMIVAFRNQQITYAQQTDLANSQARARAALAMVARDVRMAGYTGTPKGHDILATNPDPDLRLYAVRSDLANNHQITIWGNFFRQSAQLINPAGSGDTELTIDNVNIFKGTGINQPGWVVIGSSAGVIEVHEFKEVNGSNVVLNDPLLQPFPASTPTVQVVVAPYYQRRFIVHDSEYLDNHGNPLPTLYLQNLDANGNMVNEVMVATGVEDFLVNYGTVNLAGQSTSGLNCHCDPCEVRTVELRLQTVSDKLRPAGSPVRRWYSTTVRIRNVGFEVTNCPVDSCACP